ncbi:hypothetical protein [Halobacillus karajensis]|uniref:hypothetical protein n=1 Tax=Halobacillus karajensis TaxID=195088 RepID=UPI00045C957A|nr:hypothetical protein [Halobacillus karajensis]CDQ17974.1 hypothetical protein BN982_00214 [Halobacillus karajensis]
MPNLEHPEITQVNRTSLTSWQQEKHYGNDALGQEVFVGDEIFVDGEEFYLKEALSGDAVQILRDRGAKLKIARTEGR